MLLNDLFIIDQFQPGDGGVKAKLHVRFQHGIFDGHFPDRPVVPGACLVELVEELTASVLGPDIRMTEAGPIKFISMIEPRGDAPLEVTLQVRAEPGGGWRVQAEAVNGGAVCFRFRGIFQAGSDYAE